MKCKFVCIDTTAALPYLINSLAKYLLLCVCLVQEEHSEYYVRVSLLLAVFSCSCIAAELTERGVKYNGIATK